MSKTEYRLPTLITTSVVRGSQQGERHGGIYLVDFAAEEVTQAVDWNTSEIDFTGRGWDRGLRGIAFFGGEIYIAASDELFVYNRDFRIQRSFRCTYLKHCHEIHQLNNHLYLTSTGHDRNVSICPSEAARTITARYRASRVRLRATRGSLLRM